MREANEACLDHRVRHRLDRNRDYSSLEAWKSSFKFNGETQRNNTARMVGRNRALLSMIVVLMTLAQLISVTDAAAGKSIRLYFLFLAHFFQISDPILTQFTRIFL